MKVLLFASIGNDNFGDEAMFKVIYNRLKEQGKDVIVATYEIDRAKERFPEINFIKLPVFSTYQYIKGLLGKDILPIDISSFEGFYVTGGGGLNSLYFHHVMNMYLIVKKFKKEGKYIEFRPQSVGPFSEKTGFIVRLLVEKIVKMSDAFYVRELLSYEYLKRKGLKVKLARDDAWFLPADESIELLEGRYAGLCIRPWKDKKTLADFVNQLTGKLQKRGYEPLFIPIAYGGREKYLDNVFLKGKVSGIFLDNLFNIEEMTPEMIKGVIKRCSFTIGMSYHFNVFSLSLGIPSAAIYTDEYYRIKDLGLYRAFGNPDLVFKVPETPPKQIIDKLLKGKK